MNRKDYRELVDALESNTRNLKTEYFRPDDHQTPFKVTYGSNRAEVIANISRAMVVNKYGADVAVCHDTNTGEVLAVATYHIGKKFSVDLEGDVANPICIIPEGDLK